MYPWITRKVVYPAAYFLRGENVARYRHEVQAFHRLDDRRMSEVQWRKLVALIQYLAEHNRYYQDLFSANNIDPSNLRTPDEFAAIPLLTKADIKRFEPSMRSGGTYRYSVRTTSGSTGDPLIFLKDRQASGYLDAVMHEVYRWHGIEMGDRNARIWGVPIHWRGRLRTRVQDRLLNRRRLVFFNLAPDKVKPYFERLMKFRPVYLYGVANTLCEFGRTALKLGYNPSDLGVRAVIATAEVLAPFMRDFLERTYRCRIVNEYGCSETGIIAFECPHGSMHVMNHNLYLEIVDVDTGDPLPSGKPGAVVLTELHSRLMPFVRYRVGDIARLSPTPCSCGLASPVLEQIEGRVATLIEAPDGSRMSAGVVIYCMPNILNKFRVIQRTTEAIDVLVTADEPLSAKALGKIRSNISREIGHQVRVDIRQVDDIPRDASGKIRTVISDLNIEYE